MSVYVVILQKPDEKVWKVLEEKWPDRHHIWHEYVAFIAPSGITTSNRVSETLGLGPKVGEDGAGVIIEMTPAYNGYVDSNLVEWLRNAHKDRG